jgi:hypothetical protein
MSERTLHRARIAVGTGILAAVLGPFMIFASASGALAASPAWTIEKSPNATLSGGQLESVSCSSPRACTAVGNHVDTSGITITLAERWNGSIWQRQPTPDPASDTIPSVAPELLGVSCPTGAFCAAVGDYQEPAGGVSIADLWNGSYWKWQPFPVPANSAGAGLTQVSCTSATFCEAVGSYFDESDGQTAPLAAAWNGTSWRLQSTPSLTSTAAFTALSCTSPESCEAWGGGTASNSGPEIAERWNGSSWQLQTVPSNAAAVDSLSCPSATFCEAVAPGAAYNWNGSQWNAQTLPSSVSSAALNGVSCTWPRFCEAVGTANDNGNDVGVAAVWNGDEWSAQTTPNPAGSTWANLSAVSCTSASSCEAAGDYQVEVTSSDHIALAEDWNGSSWSLQRAATPPAATTNTLSGVSCVSASFCAAVGTHFDAAGYEVNLAEIWDGTSWTIEVVPNLKSQNGAPADNELDSVSCVSATFCQAAGTGPDGPSAALWNGSSWTVQPRPGADVTTQLVSCPTASFCMSADGFANVDIWNGSSWSADASVTGFSYVGSVSCLSASFCEVVGQGPSGENAAAWNGTSWVAQSTPDPASAVSCTAVSSCEAVGQMPNSSGQTDPLAEAWNGSTWTVQPAADPANSQGASLVAVSCTSASSCTAVGQNQSSSIQNFGQLQTLAEVWDGTAWSIPATPDASSAGQNLLSGVSCGASQACAAVGQYSDPGDIPATLIEAGA